MKNTMIAAALIGACSAQLQFESAQVAGMVNESYLDEISGMFAMRNSDNRGKLITCHDSDDDYMYVINSDGSAFNRIDLVGDDWRDVEEISGYTKNGTNYVVLFEFGDNPANRDKKYFFRFPEPTLNSSTVMVNNWDKVAYRLPAWPPLEKGSNKGDFEGAFISVDDNKIYFFSKRMPVNYIYSLPLQDTYSGTQTLAFEGQMSAMVAEETGGVISPANCVGAALSEDENYALVKTYNMVFQFTREAGDTWAETLKFSNPTVESNYVGRGSAPSQEPQGESICFANDDAGYYTLSEYRGNSEVPLFYYPKELPLQPFVWSYEKPAAHTHHFTITNGYNVELQGSYNLFTWQVVDSPFVSFDNGDGTTTYIYTRQDQIREFFRYVLLPDPEDLVEVAEESILDAVAGVTPAVGKDVFLNYGTSSVFTRNPDSILNGKQGLTGLVAWNTRTNGKQLGGFAITPQHVLCTLHANYVPGDTVCFVTAGNQVVVRTITHIQGTGFDSTVTDYVVCLLNSPLPASIEPLEVMPSDSSLFFADKNSPTYLFKQVPIVWVNQNEEVVIADLKEIQWYTNDDTAPNSYTANDHATWDILTGFGGIDVDSGWKYNAVPGDSGSVPMLLLGDKLVACGMFTTETSGSYLGQSINLNDIERLIIDVDAKANVSTGFTLTEANLNEYAVYE